MAKSANNDEKKAGIETARRALEKIDDEAKQPVISIDHRLRIHLPGVPNYVRIEGGTTIDVADLADDALAAIAKYWGNQLKHHANHRRVARTKK